MRRGRLLLVPVFALIALALPATALASAPTSQRWQVTGGGADIDRVRTLLPLPDGSMIVVGSFSSTTATFGTTVFTRAGAGTYASAFANDALIARVNADGTYRWIKQWGGVKPDLARGIARQSDGTIIVTGQFGGTVSFDGISRTSAGTSGWWADLFIAALDPDTGALKWLNTAGGTGDDYAYQVRTLPDDSIALVGSGQTTMKFGSFSLPAALGFGDWWVARYNADGTFRWARRVGGSTDYDDPFGFDVLADGSVFATGYSGTNAVYGATTLVNNGTASDMTVLKLNADGDVLWARRLGGPTDDFGYGITALPGGDVVVAGYVKGLVTLPDGTSLPATGGGDKDAFWARFDGSGNLVWARRAAGTGEDYLLTISARADGRLIATGAFSGTTTFGTTTLTSSGGTDMVLLSIGAADGSIEWAHRSGGTGNDVSRTSGTLGDGTILIAGNLGQTAYGAMNEDAVLQSWLTVPDALPEPVVTRSSDGTSASVAITPLAGDAITRYVVSSSATTATCDIVPPATTCTLTGLQPTTAYTFDVTASNAVGSAERESAPVAPVEPGATTADAPGSTIAESGAPGVAPAAGAIARIKLRGRYSLHAFVHVTTGSIPDGVTSITQTVTLLRSVAPRFTRMPHASITVPCAMLHGRYRCITTLAPGDWRITTTANAGAGLRATIVRRLTLRSAPHPGVTG